MAYNPDTFQRLTFHDHIAAFADGSDTPSAYLERCIATIERLEPEVQAWASLRIDGARADAAASDARYRAGSPASRIDGLPIGIKDLISTRDLPTSLGISGNENANAGTDSACILALQDAGAIILGKTVTTELGGGWPSKTHNPFDPGRTPGGSSSGSAAAVGAGMVPATIGTQVGGSIIRPAGFCANFAIKPTIGAIHRGDRQGLSQSCYGVHAGSIEDMWIVASEIAKRSGGDPGQPGLYGPEGAPARHQPARLAVMEGEGWAAADERAKTLFLATLDDLRAQGVTIITKEDDALLARFEESITEMMKLTGLIVTFENRWSDENLQRKMADKLSPVAHRAYAYGKSITLETYRDALVQRDTARQRLAALRPIADALISLANTGPAPKLGGETMPTGNPAFNCVTSALGGPVVTIPHYAIDGMPVGLQVVGQWHDDYRVTAIAGWITQTVPRACA